MKFRTAQPDTRTRKPGIRHIPSIAVLLLATSFVAVPAVAQAQSTPTPEAVVRTVSVYGTGIVKVDPDLATINVGVLKNGKTLDRAQDDVSVALEGITAALTDGGVAERDIQTSSYSINPIPRYDDDGNYTGVDGYQVSATVSVTVRDITQVGSLLDATVTAGANQVWGVSFSVDDPKVPASAARKAAVEDARAKADELAAASGAVVIGVISIQETYAPSPKSVDYPMSAGSADASAQSREVPVNPGTTDIQVDVNIVFEIEVANG